MRVRIETERMILRNVSPDDYEACFKWCGDTDVNRFLIYNLYDNADDVKIWLGSRDEDDPDNYDLGFVLKETGELIGMGGIVYSREKNLWSLGYNLRKDMWGKGLVYEALKAIIDHVRSIRPVNILEGQFCKDNKRSKRVMEKLGMHYYADSQYMKADGSRVFEAETYRIEYEAAADCSFSKGNNWFRYRTGGFIMHDNKLLFVKSNFGGYYYILGGAVHLGETSEDCILREVYEEAGIKAKIDHLAVVAENFFKGKDGFVDGMDCHVLEFYYLLKAEDMTDLKTMTDDGEELCWIGTDDVASADIKPSFVPERISEILNSSSILHILEERDR
ncbi:MAG: GNAT family N-acetyltransferase [Lachnospiraceae bacterium]|nr:GNAT family N-acetyltransferase [Lachnospiraceae bacterium]